MNNTIERKDNLEVRWTRNLTSSMRYPEIVKWEEFSNAEIVEELCYTLAYWIRSEQHPLIDDVHWDLKFVGNRSFAVAIDRDVVWSMMKKTQTMLDALEQEDEKIMKHIQTHNLELTKEELKTVIQSIECFIDPLTPRWAKDEEEDVDIILLLNKFKDRFYGS